jgi:hypothetical protein
MKLVIQILQSKMPEDKPTPKISIKDRVEYAIDCIACGHNKAKAIEFLRKAKAKLEGETSQTREYQDLLGKIDTALVDYGHYHIETKDK